MSDSFPRARPGQRLKIAADWYNRTSDAADAYLRTRENQGTADAGLPRETATVKVRNTTGAALDAFAPVALDAATIGPAEGLSVYLFGTTLDGKAPNGPSDTGALGVLLEPLEDDAIGRAAVAGIVPVRLSADDEPEAGDCVGFVAGVTDYLGVVDDGRAVVLWVGAEGDGDPGDGLLWALILLGAALCKKRPVRPVQRFTRCINGDLTTYEVGTDGVPRIVAVQSGCCSNDSGTHSGGAYGPCTSPAFDLETGGPEVADTGGTPVSVSDPACVHAQPSVCLVTATVGGGDPAAPADTCGDGSGQVWTGSNLAGSWALYKCGILWCLSTTPADPTAEPTTTCSAISPSADPCAAPAFGGVFFLDPETGSPYTATITPTAGSSCTWNCWVSGTGDPGSTLHYCSTSDDSGTATMVSGPYTTEAACVAACPGDHYCIQQLVYDAADTGCAGDPVATLDSVCAVEWAPDGCFVDSGGNPTAYQVLSGPYATHAACIAACAAPWYCWQWVHYTDADCTTPSGETEAGVCAQTIDDTCMPTGDGYRKRQIVSGPYDTHDDCSGVC